ncbi:hypothetical protein [Amycolatopsis eburnea]|uniref:hypothetical protein n=1 Tax=Amycolatopsis eburnea TaxID=2267691 RepID=UPI001CDC11D6|nr:hypothetical protein [Amycolatopsis eburnea]
MWITRLCGLRELVNACDEIVSTAAGTEVAGLVRSMHLAASWICELWQGDTTPLDGERMALLHNDLAGFAGHAEGVRTLLAEGGGWTSLAP